MKIFKSVCPQLKANGGILKDEDNICYYKPGYRLHREDGPTREWYDGEKEWWYNGKCIVLTNGDVTPEQLLDFKLRIL